MKRTLTFICAMLLLASIVAVAADNSPVPASTPGSEDRVTLQLKDTPLSDVLTMLFKVRRGNYVLGPMPNAPTVTIILQEVPFEDALAAVMKAVGATYTRANGTYYFAMAPSAVDEATEAQLMTQLADLYGKLTSLRKTYPESHPDVMMAKGTLADVERKLCQLWVRTASIQTSQIEQKPAEKPISEVIQLRYLRPADIAPMVQTVSGVRTITTVGTNKLLVTGTKSAIEEVKTLIATLDDESAFPKPVRVKVEVRVDVTQSGQKPTSCSLSSDGVGAMGSSIPIMLDVTPLPNDSRYLVGQFSAQITPSAAPDGTISLRGDGSFKCQMGRETISKPFSVLSIVVAGKPVVIASGSYAIEDRTASFEVLAAVTVDAVPSPPAPKKQPAKPR